MGISLERQLVAFLYAMLTGCLCGVFYDGIRVSRVLFGIARYTRTGDRLYDRSLWQIGRVRPVGAEWRHRWIRLSLLFFGDVLFGAIGGAAFSIFLYHAASGCFRWFYLLGCAVGFVLYYQTAGRLVMLSSEILVFCLRVIFRYLIWTLLAPFRGIWWLLRRMGAWMYCFACRPICKILQRRWHLRYTHRVRDALSADVRMTLADEV